MPDDALEVVASHGTLVVIEMLAACCHNLRARLLRDELLLGVAIAWRGARFWQCALTRKTQREFLGMRRELGVLYRFETNLVRHDHPLWTFDNYLVFWRAEAEFALAHPKAPHTSGTAERKLRLKENSAPWNR